MKKIIYLFTFFSVFAMTAQDYSQVISSYLNNNRLQLGFQNEDISDVKINSHSYSKSMNVENVYVSQQYKGIEIFNSTASFAIKEGSVVHATTTNFEVDLSKKINATNPLISAETAITKAVQALGLQNPEGVGLLETISSNEYVFSKGSVSLNDIPVKLVYQTEESDKLRLAWDLSIYLLDASHYYNVRIDALTGELIDTNDWVISCNYGEQPHSHAIESQKGKSMLFADKTDSTPVFMADGSQYRVFSLPAESPIHGNQSLVVEPANEEASPFGWHDTNGVVGPEFTITRGNNVYAYDDIDGNNVPGTSPDGGTDLNFDFSQVANTNPLNNLDGATVNLFYMNNVMHDIWYQYGFDEASGNFQVNNYSNDGEGNDSVNAEAQDGSGLNNANFATPPDGISGRMQMYLWNAPATPLGGEALTINNGPLAGTYNGTPATFGNPLPQDTMPLTGELALAEDDNSGGTSTDPLDACDVITNGAELDGKIAVLRRGDCEFGLKVLNAENEGAIAVIVVNNVPDDPIVMGGGDNGNQVTIPSIMVNQADGDAIIAQLQANETINVSLVEVPPYQKDGDLDNGIVAHEYGHGISNRLTGGPVNASCLRTCTQVNSNGDCIRFSEQMGEGWSDWFALMLTIEPGDQGTDSRGFGTYTQSEPVTGPGIREAPYSTDTSINNYTYGDTATGAVSVPHGIGFVWASMLWDLTWDFIDEYGFDSDLYNGTGGNNMMMQLVVDGMKLQNCQPGFEDARDAILEADELVNGGANRCMIWEAFADRGLGVNADQGTSLDRSDNTEGFDVPSGPNCTLANEDRGSLNRNFIIYPNPSNGIINIKSLLNVGDVNISVFDMNGRKVLSQDVTLNSTVNINASGLSSGVYVVEINGGNYSHTARVLIR